MTALRREVEELKIVVANLRDQVRLTEQNHEERMNCHREDINWQREECILLRAGLQENEDRTAELSVQGQQIARQLCRCADHQGPLILAVGLPLPPPYERSPSLEFHIPPIKVRLIDDAESIPSSPAPVPVPPPAPESPILFSDAENIPPACCANPTAPRALLQPIEEVVSDAKDSDSVVERLEDQIGDETALSFLNGGNQGRGVCCRAVHAIGHHPAPYSHHMQPGEQIQQQRDCCFNLRRGGYQCSSSESDSSSEDCVLLDGPPA